MTVNVGPLNSLSYTRILWSAASGSFRDFPGPGATEPLKETAYGIISMLVWIIKIGRWGRKSIQNFCARVPKPSLLRVDQGGLSFRGDIFNVSGKVIPRLADCDTMAVSNTWRKRIRME